MPIRLSVPFALIALGCAGPVLAAPATSAAPAAESSDSEVVGEVQKVTGSRLGAKRVCLTRAEWRQQRRDNREETERAQRLRQSNFVAPPTDLNL